MNLSLIHKPETNIRWKTLFDMLKCMFYRAVYCKPCMFVLCSKMKGGGQCFRLMLLAILFVARIIFQPSFFLQQQQCYDIDVSTNRVRWISSQSRDCRMQTQVEPDIVVPRIFLAISHGISFLLSFAKVKIKLWFHCINHIIENSEFLSAILKGQKIYSSTKLYITPVSLHPTGTLRVLL